MTKAVFLDLDGTLTDPKPGITGAVQHALRAQGVQPPAADDLEWVIGPALLDSFARLGAPDPQEALDHYRAAYAARGLFDLTVYPGVTAALDALAAAGHRQFLATAKPHVYAVRITARFGLDQHLEQQYGPELDGTRNDKGLLLLHALEALQLDPSACVMVGDRGSDLVAARKSGMRFVGVAWGYHQPGELDGADALCAAAEMLPAAVASLW